MSRHPNTKAAAVATAPTALVLWLLSLSGVDFPPGVDALIAGAVISGVLFVGREGLRGVAARVWRGRA